MVEAGQWATVASMPAKPLGIRQEFLATEPRWRMHPLQVGGPGENALPGQQAG